eukprot:scaffold3165_cov380-Prasinococcus_capsulatus_cf.AAC.15
MQAAGGRGARRRNARTYPAVKTQVVAEAGAEEKAPRTMAGNALNIGAVVGGTTVVIGGGTMLSHQLGIEEYTGPIGFFALLAGCAAWYYWQHCTPCVLYLDLVPLPHMSWPRATMSPVIWSGGGARRWREMRSRTSSLRRASM